MQIHALSTGTVSIKSRHLRAAGEARLTRAFDVFRDPDWSDPLPIHVWLIDHPEGLILVDSGDTATETTGFAHPFHRLAVRKGIAPEDEIVQGLRRLGVRPSDIRWLVLTHLHVDHDGGIKSFPKAETIVARGEYRQAAGIAGRLRGYLPQRWPEMWRPTLVTLEPEPYGTFAQSLRLTAAGDVILVPTPGHTPHHLSVIVKQGDLHYFLAGDTSYTQGHLLEGIIDGVAPQANVARDTLARICRFAETQATVYLPSHDPASAARLGAQQTVYPQLATSG